MPIKLAVAPCPGSTQIRLIGTGHGFTVVKDADQVRKSQCEPRRKEDEPWSVARTCAVKVRSLCHLGRVRVCRRSVRDHDEHEESEYISGSVVKSKLEHLHEVEDLVNVAQDVHQENARNPLGR